MFNNCCWQLNEEAIVKTGSKHFNIVPNINILPIRGCNGSFTKCLPNGVNSYKSFFSI